MKNVVLVALATVALFSNAHASHGNEVSLVVSQAFHTEFADAQNVHWDSNDDFAKASFTLNGENVYAYYNYDGSIVGSSKKIALNKLPEAALRNFTKKYPFPIYNLKDCIEFTDADGETNYFISLDDIMSNKRIIIKISTDGNMYLFKKLSITKR
ncbi:MAG: hypothetical protein KF781_07170 [Chitinophagaceae bacterium]|nr:hypothetical protein [Chitinophagaceae bacterium]MCW5903996.1 hypothetical protein [Chitinophagaceae bacterium]